MYVIIWLIACVCTLASRPSGLSEPSGPSGPSNSSSRLAQRVLGGSWDVVTTDNWAVEEPLGIKYIPFWA